MSLAEVPPPDDEWGDGPASYAPGNAPSGGRTPPQDVAAEQSVLGAMMISKDAIADVLDVIRGQDYYRPAHESIHDAAMDLYGRGEPVDMITVAGELQRRGELAKVGGAPYLHTLAANVPIAANAGYYAAIVREKAILRRLVDAGTKIVQTGYAGEGEVDNIVDAAQAEIYAVTDRRKAEDYAPLSDIMDAVLDEIEAIENREAGIYGVPTGFADLDELTNGLHAGQMIVVAARPAMGKALALDTPLADPHGLDDHGRGPGRRPAVRRPRPPDDRGRGHRCHDRPALLRGRVLGWVDDRCRRRAPVAHDAGGRGARHAPRPTLGATVRTAHCRIACARRRSRRPDATSIAMPDGICHQDRSGHPRSHRSPCAASRSTTTSTSTSPDAP